MGVVRTDRASLVDQVLRSQWVIYRAMRRGTIPTWLGLDLTMSQLKALVVLFENGPLPIGQLGCALGIGPPAASLLVDALVRQELVERVEDPRDRRRTLAGLTARARDLIVQLGEGRRERLEAWLSQVDDDDLNALARGLQALADVTATAAAPDSAPR